MVEPTANVIVDKTNKVGTHCHSQPCDQQGLADWIRDIRDGDTISKMNIVMISKLNIILQFP